MTIEATVVADSISDTQCRLTTFKLVYPRFIHSEVMTHRMLTKNSASCLTGDTLVYIEKPSALDNGIRCAHMKWTIEELYKKYHYGDSLGRSMKYRIESMKFRCLNEDTGIFTTTTIKDVVYTGEQDVFKITLKNGYNITCTDSHRLYTDKGWTTLKDQRLTKNGVISWNKDFPKIATNGFEISKEFLLREKQNGKSIKQISEETGIKYVVLSDLYNKNEISDYKDKEWLLARKKEGLTNGRIAELCNTTEDRVKKSCKRLNVGGYVGTILTGNKKRVSWNLGKTYHHSDEKLVNVRAAAKRRIKKDSYKLYDSGFKTKLVRFMDEYRQEILKKYNFRCQLTGTNRELEIHHIIPIWYDKSKAFDKDNLIVVNELIHDEIHGRHLDLKFMEHVLSGKNTFSFLDEYKDVQVTIDEINKPRGKGNTLVARFYSVKNIEYIGKKKTYDIEVKGPYHNFVANGIVVHNSRAIPVERVIKSVIDNPAKPIRWGVNQKGMQAEEELPECKAILAEQVWIESMQSQVGYAKKLIELGVHKQIVNRLLEPFFHISTLLSGTDFANFFNLRAHPDAQPEFEELAFCMLDAYESSKPRLVAAGDWHLPFADKYIKEGLPISNLVKIVTARAARVSYANFKGDINYDDDYRLHDDLVSNGHFSPTEHAAQATNETRYYANFRGYIQYRKFIHGENKTDLDTAKLRRGRRKNEKKNKMEEVERPL